MATATLSERGAVIAAQPGLDGFLNLLDDIYDPDLNVNGIVSLAVAENTLMHADLLDYIHRNFSMISHSLTYGDGAFGSKRLRDAAAHFINRHFNPYVPVERIHINATLGVSNANEMLAYVLGNAGDGFLIGRPFYRTFVEDFELRAGTVGVSLGSTDPFSVNAVARYEEMLLKSNAEGTNIKALVLCNPHNPLGQCYPREAIIAYMKFCQKHQIHLFSDEIYALSIWANPEATDKPTFTSALSIDTQGIIDPGLVHVVWGMSKDFGANGLRMGFIIDQHNAHFRRSLLAISLVNQPAAPADRIAGSILADDAFTDSYIKANSSRIAEKYIFTTAWLRDHGIPYAPGCNAGFFLWIDLGSTVAPQGKYDHNLLLEKISEHRLALADALAFGGEEEGWFRIIFSHHQKTLELAFRRLQAAIDAYKLSTAGRALPIRTKP